MLRCLERGNPRFLRAGNRNLKNDDKNIKDYHSREKNYKFGFLWLFDVQIFFDKKRWF